jgi:hypothetical protein
MTRLVLAPKFTEGIEEKLLKSRSEKSGQKYLQKSQKWKTLQLKIGDDSIQNDSYIDVNQEFTRCETTRTSSHSLEDWRDLSLLRSSLGHEAHPNLAK